jgi:hypothetical protein
LAIGVHQHRAGAEVHLCGVTWREAQPHSHLGRLFAAQGHQHAGHGRVAAGVAVLAHERRVDRLATHAGGQPARDHRAMRLYAGDGAGRAPGLAQHGDDLGVVGQRRGGVQPAALGSQRAQRSGLVAAHQS